MGARLITAFAVGGISLGAFIGLIRGIRLGPEFLAVAILKGMVLGASLAAALGWLEQIALHKLWRRLAIGRAILVRTALYAPIALGIFIAVSAVFSPWIPWALQREMVLPSLGITVASVLSASAAVALTRLLGFRVLRNFFSGRYHRPFEEERIFLFLDLVGSTTIAERIGNLRYHAFLHDFIEDLEDPLLEHEGDVYQYVGDEVVVSWPLSDPRANGRCLACHFAMLDAIERAHSRYEERYGMAPAFRTGIHCGRIVAGEIGDRRKQIVFVGDVVNTASRVQAEAKAREKNLLVSGALLKRIELPPGVEAQLLGEVQLKGKREALELFEIVRQ